jgi:hypothetical protein
MAGAVVRLLANPSENGVFPKPALHHQIRLCRRSLCYSPFFHPRNTVYRRSYTVH